MCWTLRRAPVATPALRSSAAATWQETRLGNWRWPSVGTGRSRAKESTSLISPSPGVTRSALTGRSGRPTSKGGSARWGWERLPEWRSNTSTPTTSMIMLLASTLVPKASACARDGTLRAATKSAQSWMFSSGSALRTGCAQGIRHPIGNCREWRWPRSHRQTGLRVSGSWPACSSEAPWPVRSRVSEPGRPWNRN